MTKTLGSITLFIIIAAIALSNPEVITSIVGTTLRFFSGGLNAVVNDNDQQIIINMPEADNAPEGGYQP